MAGGPGAFSCTCGRLAGTIDDLSPSGGTHIECFCDSCRAFQVHLGHGDPRPNGVHLFQTSPDAVHFTRGAENLAVLKLTPKGPLRWYAACCNAPLFITLRKPGLPFATLVVDRLADPTQVGKVRMTAFKRGKDGQQHHKGAGGMALRLFQRMAAARLSGRWKQTPFFDIATGEPVAEPRVLSREERAAAMGQAG